MCRLPPPSPGRSRWSFGAARLIALAAVAWLAGCRTGDLTPVAPGSAVPPARDAFVVLSGGGTPTSNNYSQYLQARAMAAFFRERYPPEAVWTFFGAGNREGEPPVLADVYQQVKEDNLLLDRWIPGALPDNRPATRDHFLRVLRSEILPRVRGGGTLYLFVGDHGELTEGKKRESAITMWGLNRDSSAARGWTTARNYALTVSELRAALADGLGAGRVVFAMTQCHSGGFHELGVPREVQPPRAWFVSPPGWLGATPKPPPLAAGFTATDEASIAAGCDPAADPDSWFGYERFFPESLLGRDLHGRAPARPGGPLAGFAVAHEAALAVDHTIDKPRRSSEHYLERWAALLEDQLARELLLAPAVRAALEAYQQFVDTGSARAADPAWQAAHARHAAHVERMIAQNPALRSLLLAGKRAALEKPPARRGRDAPPAEDDGTVGALSRPQSQAWREVIRPAWTKAVAEGAVDGLPAAARPLELRLQQIDTRGRPPGFSDAWSDRALNELYWASSYAVPARFDAATAATVTRWATHRRAAILAWAGRSPDPAVREAAGKFGAEYRAPRRPPRAPTRLEIPAETAAARTLYQRRVLGAWAFLLATRHEAALAELRTLQELEQRPLPPPAAPGR